MFSIELFDYRDPIFGIITIFIFIFITSFLTYSFGIYKEKKMRREYRKLLKRFELGNLKEDDYIHLYSTYNLPFDSIILLASSFLSKGQYNKAISVYLTLLEYVDDRVKKEELLELLGNTYFKSGFLQRSKEIYLKILKFSPKNKVALKHLLLIFQYLKEFEKAEDVLDSLSELNDDITKEKLYIKILKTINDPILNFDIKSNILYNNFLENNNLERVVVEYLIKFNKNLFWDNINRFNPLNIIDILWYLDFDDINFIEVDKNILLTEIYSAKGYIDTTLQSDQFELGVLIAINNSKSKVNIDLNFEFICKRCKRTHPIYNSRCPHCHDILSFIVEPKLAKTTTEIKSLL